MAVISGGTTLIDNGTLDSAVPSGKLILLSTQTASSSSAISFTSGINSTYDSYVFNFINIHPATSNVTLQFQCSTDGGSNYNTTLTSTIFRAYHEENGSAAGLGYKSDQDQAQGTGFQIISQSIGNNNDDCFGGNLSLFNPSSTYVKHYMSRVVATYATEAYSAGYFNTTSAINAIRFQMSSGNIDDGIIKMYGVG